jgi:predicted DNA-binding transcriptional regulator AlpA
MSDKPKKIGPRQGAVVVWPSGVQERYGISAPTLWRWEKLKRLPPRDVNIGGKTGWRPATLAAAEQGPHQSAAGVGPTESRADVSAA